MMGTVQIAGYCGEGGVAKIPLCVHVEKSYCIHYMEYNPDCQDNLAWPKHIEHLFVCGRMDLTWTVKPVYTLYLNQMFTNEVV